MIEQSGSGATSRAYDFGRFNEQLFLKELLSAGSGSRTLLVRSYLRSFVPEMRFLVNTRCITSSRSDPLHCYCVVTVGTLSGLALVAEYLGLRHLPLSSSKAGK